MKKGVIVAVLMMACASAGPQQRSPPGYPTVLVEYYGAGEIAVWIAARGDPPEKIGEVDKTRPSCMRLPATEENMVFILNELGTRESLFTQPFDINQYRHWVLVLDPSITHVHMGLTSSETSCLLPGLRGKVT